MSWPANIRIFPPLFFSILLFHFMAGQQTDNIVFERISTEKTRIEKGLSQNSVFCMAQDHIGYMWYGTWDGLNMFDGYNFTIYKDDSCGLSNPTIKAIFEDADHTLWVGTEGGLNRFDRKHRKFISYRHSDYNPSGISSDTILCITEDKKGVLWIGTQNGLNKFDKKTGLFFSFKYNPSSQNSNGGNIIFDIVIDSLNNMWLATDNGLSCFDTESNSFIRPDMNPVAGDCYSKVKILSLLLDSRNRLWMGTTNGVCLYSDGIFRHFKGNKKDIYSLENNDVYDIIEDKCGKLWFATYGGGLFSFNEENGHFEHQGPELTGHDKNPGDLFLYCMHEDNSGILWIGTYGNGVNYINSNSNKFVHYSKYADKKSLQISNNIIWAIIDDPDYGLWVGSDFGIDILDRESGEISTLRNNPGNPNSLPDNLIRTFFHDTDNQLWIGTFNSGAVCYDMKTGKFNRRFTETGPGIKISSDLVWCIIRDRLGFVWFGTNQGLNMYNPENESVKVFIPEKNNPGSLSGIEVYDIYEDNYGNIWVSTNYGLNKYDRKTGLFTRYLHQPGNKNSIASNKVFCIYQDKFDTYWIGTVGGGLVKYNDRKNEFHRFDESYGLTNNTIYCIIDDGNGNLWMSSNGGVFKFDTEHEVFINYGVEDGVQSNEFNLGAAFKNSSGEIFFGGMNGFNSFFPEQIVRNRFIPHVVVTQFSIFNNPLKRTLMNNDTITLSHNDNFFSFEFSALDYTQPDKNKYAYFLEGFDKQWVYCDANHRFAEYTKVPPGTYHFFVKGSNNAGTWNDEGMMLTVIIPPPWWKTAVFIIPFWLIIAIIIWYIIYKEFKRIRKKHHLDMQLNELERKALRLQMNPHFIFNTLNSIQFFILKNDKLSANRYLTMFSRLMRMILNNSQKNNIPLKDELDALRLYVELEQLRFENKFSFEIIIENEENDIYDIRIPTM
ncbi:MAG: two-component regulator propeller domain-containing protein, partial [Bacteroidota bacterium]